MSERLIFRFLLWLLMAGAAAWFLLSAFEKSVDIAEMFVSDPEFPARYLGFMMVVFTIACMIALGAFVISLSVAWHGPGLFHRETDGIRGEVREIREYVGMGGESD